MITGNATFYKNVDETIRKKVKKSDFFWIFRDFSEPILKKWTIFG
jgi:hypothetical protein